MRYSFSSCLRSNYGDYRPFSIKKCTKNIKITLHRANRSRNHSNCEPFSIRLNFHSFPARQLMSCRTLSEPSQAIVLTPPVAFLAPLRMELAIMNFQNPAIQRRRLLQLGGLSALGTGGSFLAGCRDAESPLASSQATAVANRYVETSLVANQASYQAKFLEPGFVNAWGIAIRPAGAGGHFWVGAGGTSWQYVGDVQKSADAALRMLFQDGLKKVAVPGADALTSEASVGKTTGVVYNGAELNSPNFRVSGQTAGGTAFDGSARFAFVTDSGKVSAWTDRSNSGSIVRVDGPAAEVFDGAADGSAFFGVAIKPGTWDTMWLADFGTDPKIVTLDKNWKKVATTGFSNPFGSGKNGAVVPCDPVPFNIQVLGSRVWVTFAVSKPDPAKSGSFQAAEEDALDASQEAATANQPNKGKLVEYDLTGQQVRIYDDAKRLNAPWGVAIAPADFGQLSGALLVGNFGGAGRICAFDIDTGQYIDDLRDEAGKPVGIAGLWALQFGNGEGLGDSNALYFAAGPKDEADGVFGSLRVAGLPYAAGGART